MFPTSDRKFLFAKLLMSSLVEPVWIQLSSQDLHNTDATKAWWPCLPVAVRVHLGPRYKNSFITFFWTLRPTPQSVVNVFPYLERYSKGILSTISSFFFLFLSEFLLTSMTRLVKDVEVYKCFSKTWMSQVRMRSCAALMLPQQRCT